MVVIEQLASEKYEALKILLPGADLGDVKRFMKKRDSIMINLNLLEQN